MVWGDHYLSQAAKLFGEAEREKDIKKQTALEREAWDCLRMATQAKGNDLTGHRLNGDAVIKTDKR